ncbi:MAG: NUDIX domain-containing protein, partial [Pontibacterium sp.]
MKKWSPQFDASALQVLSTERCYDGFFKLDRLTLKHATFDGGEVQVERELLVRRDAVCVLLFDPHNDVVVMVEQLRVGAYDHPRGPWMLEVVAGIVEDGETPEDVARREAMEESGVEVTELIPITCYSPSPGGTRENIHLYCALIDSTGIGGVHGLHAEGEDILVHLLDSVSLFSMVREGILNNAASIIALQWL